LYTRWPKPKIFCPAARVLSTYSSAFSADSIARSARIAVSFAPPWRGPFKVAIAATTHEYRSGSVDAATAAANVPAFIEWSAWRISAESRIRAVFLSGFFPVSIRR
jgi:hypothetical protein